VALTACLKTSCCMEAGTSRRVSVERRSVGSLFNVHVFSDRAAVDLAQPRATGEAPPLEQHPLLRCDAYLQRVSYRVVVELAEEEHLGATLRPRKRGGEHAVEADGFTCRPPCRTDRTVRRIQSPTRASEHPSDEGTSSSATVRR